MMNWQVIEADVLDWAASYDGPKFHAMLCDSPYELGFMSRDWDKSGIAFRPETWAALAQHLHPGAFVMAFASSRGWHRLAVAIEDAGLIIQPSIFGWATGQSFPKATRIDTQIDANAPRVAMFKAFAQHFEKCWRESGLKRTDFVSHFPHYKNSESIKAQLSNWKLAKNVPTRQDFEILKRLINLSDEYEPLIARLEAEREVVGRGEAGFLEANQVFELDNPGYGKFDITIPATDLARAWVGHRYGGQVLKNALEPIICAQVPWIGKRLDCIVETGAGSLWVDGARVTVDGERPLVLADRGKDTGNTFAGGLDGTLHGSKAAGQTNQGRWPANFTLQHDPGCQRVGVRKVKREGGASGIAKEETSGYGGYGERQVFDYADPDGTETVADWRCTLTCPVRRLGEQSGERPSGGRRAGESWITTGEITGFGGDYAERMKQRGAIVRRDYVNDTGTAARFFHQSDWSYEIAERLALADPVRYQAKASRKERDSGLTERDLCGTIKQNTGGKQWGNMGQSQVTQAEEDTQPKRDTTDLPSGIQRQSQPETSSPTPGSGSKQTGQSQKDTTSTTSTETNKTTGLKTCNLSASETTRECIPDASSEMEPGGNPANSVESSSQLMPNIGISPERDTHNMDVVEGVTSERLSNISVSAEQGKKEAQSRMWVRNPHPT